MVAKTMSYVVKIHELSHKCTGTIYFSNFNFEENAKCNHYLSILLRLSPSLNPLTPPTTHTDPPDVTTPAPPLFSWTQNRHNAIWHTSRYHEILIFSTLGQKLLGCFKMSLTMLILSGRHKWTKEN